MMGVAREQEVRVDPGIDLLEQGGAIPAAGGSILDSKAVLYGGIGAAGVVTGLILSQDDDPVSPAAP